MADDLGDLLLVPGVRICMQKTNRYREDLAFGERAGYGANLSWVHRNERLARVRHPRRNLESVLARNEWYGLLLLEVVHDWSARTHDLEHVTEALGRNKA